ncbi:MAG: VanZ family protein, partial [Calditrichaeota bacterium]|nr:VanZ family protein [Calditrichota bacterium]
MLSNNYFKFSEMLRLFLFAVVLILLLTLFPFDFYGKTSLHSFTGLWNELTVLRSDFLQDFVANILLFLPLGFGLGGLVAKRTSSHAMRVFFVALVAFALSSGIEALQFYLPSRITSLYDILSNTLGAVLGEIVFSQYGSIIRLQAVKIRQRLEKIFTTKRLLISVFIYMAVFLAFTKTLPYAASLETWNPDYSLLVGNEKSGDRPWEGVVRKFAVLDSAMSPNTVRKLLNDHIRQDGYCARIICLYDFTESDPLKDKTGRLPDLQWCGNEQTNARKNPHYFSQNHWLQSTQPVTALVKRVKATNQFSVYIVLATADTVQNGPARILTVSKDAYHRNFTLAQEGKDLAFRLNTPLTGENGNAPEFIARNVFACTE